MRALSVAAALVVAGASTAQAHDSTSPHWPGEGERRIVLVNALSAFPLPSYPRGDQLVAEVAAAWSRSPGVELLVEQGSSCQPREGAIVLCHVRRLSTLPPFVIASEPKAGVLVTYEIANSQVTIQQAVVELVWSPFRPARCGRLPKCAQARRRVMRYRLCHEIGHALGLPHRELIAPSCMAHGGQWPDEQDLAQIATLHGVQT